MCESRKYFLCVRVGSIFFHRFAEIIVAEKFRYLSASDLKFACRNFCTHFFMPQNKVIWFSLDWSKIGIVTLQMERRRFEQNSFI